MSVSPARPRKTSDDTYRPKIVTTVGAKPACLVNASVTYVGNDEIYAFGGFDQFTDEVYNHVLRLNLQTRQWSLVDNYGDIPGVRMGHTTSLWQGDKLLVFGGENEHRTYLSDVIVFNLKTATWQQPPVTGPTPRGRARHSAVIHDDKLFITGGVTGEESYCVDDISYLDLKTWTWSRAYKFVPRYDHTTWVWNGRIWVFGGLGEDMQRTTEIWWLDLQGNPTFDGPLNFGATDNWMSTSRSGRQHFGRSLQASTGSTGYAANSSSVQTNNNQYAARNATVAPGTVASLKFVSSPNLPTQAYGAHFHVFTSGSLLDFATPASVMSSSETSLSSLDLDSMRWSRVADGKDLFHPAYRWHYCAMNEDGTQAWLLGCPSENADTLNGDNANEYLSDVLPIDLRKLGLLGNSLTMESRLESSKIPSSDANVGSHLAGIGADLANTFDQPPEVSGADFAITAERDDEDPDDATMDGSPAGSAVVSVASQPIHVHRWLLTARWPHFKRLYAAQMRETHSNKMHIPEPYSAVRAFLKYLYTDNITAPPPTSAHPYPSPTLNDVGGMLVMADLYDMPRLRLLCVNRLGRELNVEHAAFIWERACTANEEWLKRRSASFCMLHWGRVVRTAAFKCLSRRSMMALCEETDVESRVVNGDELEAVGGLGGGRYGMGGNGGPRRRSAGTGGVAAIEDADAEEEADEEGMDVN